ncbi:Predicted DNA-binding transcriptional regulator YafY, contains an HTH and WYL domains [Jiangella sp. DSM 45060]|nr:Predicted DNA-binding transcriptional regulator YafY, contains an HTH and WYL domains [Jiangella sp. DSM 45060]
MAGGRDQLGPLERVTRVLVALVAAEPKGIPTPRLLRIAAFGGGEDHHVRQLKRLIEDLNGVGWDIRNTAPPGQTAVYRAFAGDNRLRLTLTPEQRTELARAALIAGNAAFAERAGIEGTAAPPIPELRTAPLAERNDEALNKVLYALERHCRLRFLYKRRQRLVHPHFVYPGTSGWHLVGHEDGSEKDKQFVTDRMSDVRVDLPRTADPRHEPFRDEVDPLMWAVDEPVDVTVETTPAHRNQVETLLGTPSYHEIDDDVVRLTIRVTHRAAFRNRVYELGPRVRVLAPETIRSELLLELESLLD